MVIVSENFVKSPKTLHAVGRREDRFCGVGIATKSVDIVFVWIPSMPDI